MKICTAQTVVLVAVFMLLPYLTVFSQGESCDMPIPVTDEIITSAGILAIGGSSASNACFSVSTAAVWYVYTATCNGLTTVSSSIDLDEPDTRVSIHTDCVAL
ncbi:MAG: hypothetical protein ACI8U0_002649, partial [Flavobacteriales bacterium]